MLHRSVSQRRFTVNRELPLESLVRSLRALDFVGRNEISLRSRLVSARSAISTP